MPADSSLAPDNTLTPPPADSSLVVSTPVTAPAVIAADGPTSGQPNPNGSQVPPADSVGDVDANNHRGNKPKLNLAAYQELMKNAPAVLGVPAADPNAAVAPAPAPAVVAPVPPVPAAPDDDQHRPNLRYRADAVEATLINLAKQTQGKITDIGLINAARAVHGLEPLAVAPGAAPAPAAVATPTPIPAITTPETAATPAVPASVTDAEAKIASLREQRLQAKNNFDFEAEERLELEIDEAKDALRELKLFARQQAEQAHVSAETQFTNDWNANMAIAEESYPDSVKPGTPLAVKAAELQQAAILRNDPIAQSADSGLFFVTKAARELGIAPVIKTTAAVVTPPIASTSPTLSTRAPLSAMIAGGSPQSPSPSAPDSSKQFTNIAEYQAMLAQSKGIHYGGRPARSA
jgi:hypothetical protein